MTHSIRKIMACRTFIAHSKPHVLNPSNITTETCPPRSQNNITFAFPSFPTDSPRFLAGWWYTYPSEKWWSSSVGMMTFHCQNDGKVIKFHGSSQHQPVIIPHKFIQIAQDFWDFPFWNDHPHDKAPSVTIRVQSWDSLVPAWPGGRWSFHGFSGGIMDVLWIFYGCVHGKYGCYGKSM